MFADPVALANAGMVTSVGLSAPSSAAAIRAGLSNASQTQFMDWGGQWLAGHSVPIEHAAGPSKLVRMAAMAIDECLMAIDAADRKDIPLVLCVAEPSRPGRMEGLDRELIAQIGADLGLGSSDDSVTIAEGRVAGVIGLRYARSLLLEGRAHAVVLAGVDSYLHWPTLSVLEGQRRLLTSRNSNGFIPGEAAGAVLLTKIQTGEETTCIGIGTATETATIDSDDPLRAEGLIQAIQAAATDANREAGDFDFRICDLSGPQYYFKEAMLALMRTSRRETEEVHLWHPADCIGETGAAAGPLVLAVAAMAGEKGYAPGRDVLCHFSNDGGQRAALYLRNSATR